MAVALSCGELPQHVWDWITFNNPDSSSFNFEMLGEAALAMGREVGPRGVSPVVTEYQPLGYQPILADNAEALFGMLMFPTVVLEDGFLGYSLGSMTQCHGQSLRLGNVLDERVYVYLGDGYPKSIFSARFDTGYICIADSPLEDLYLENDVHTVVVNQENPTVVLRPIVERDLEACRRCLELKPQCLCKRERELELTLADKMGQMSLEWDATARPEYGTHWMGMWRRFLEFTHYQISNSYGFSQTVTTEDATALGVPSGTVLMDSLLEFEFHMGGSLMENAKLMFMARMLSHWSPEKVIASGSELSSSLSRDVPSLEGVGEDSPAPATAETAEEELRPSCHICGAVFARKYEVSRHIKVVHNTVKEFACTICGRAFALRQHLNAHIKAVHEKKRDHACPQCGMNFATEAKVNRHVRCVHLKERAYKCSECGKEYFQQSDLIRHMKRSHELDEAANPVAPSCT